MRWPLTFYVDSLPGNQAGCAQGPVIRILKSSREDVGLYRHELTHVKQWLFTLGIHSFLYLFSESYRLYAEVQAYQKQATCYPDDRLPLFASYIATRYGLSVTADEALGELRLRK